MKNHTASIVLLAAALTVSALTPMSAAPKNDLPIAFSVHAFTAKYQGLDQIERGATRTDVSRAMRGQSRQELTPDVWIYSGYKAEISLANEHGCGTLIITFANDKVVDLKLVNKPAVAVIAANLKLSPAVRNIASKK